MLKIACAISLYRVKYNQSQRVSAPLLCLNGKAARRQKNTICLKGRKRMKRKLQKAISVLLLLAMVVAVLPMAYADKNFTNSETYLRTSYNNDNYVELSISGNMLTVSGKLLFDGLTGLMVKCGEHTRKYIDAASGQKFSVRVPLSHSGSLPISIYTQKRGERTYWGYSWDKFYIEKTGGGYRIMPSLVLDRNLAFARAYVDPDHFRDSSEVPDSVKALSNQIVGGETDDYAKIFLLHKWTAENIYYDYDAYRGGKDTFYDSENILATKRSVCEGYANLLRDLILAQGIPCMKATTYSLGVSTNGGSYAVSANEANVDKSNHAHVEAWADGYWVAMDPTWDSNNEYENGKYNTDAPNGFYYFDITPEALALDHKYIDRANGKLKMQNGVITGADTPPSIPGFTDVPSNAYYADPVQWAVENKITSGSSKTTFSPGATCSRAQILSFLWRASGSPEPKTANPFQDIKSTDYFYKAALWAAENGMVSGSAFGASTPCTRASTMEYMWKASGSPAPSGKTSFDDVPANAGNARAIAWAVENGITAGTSKTTFSPDSTCTRGQIVTFLYRAFAK